MCPSYLIISINKADATHRFIEWMKRDVIDGPRLIPYDKAVNEAVENDQWRGTAVMIYEDRGKTVFEDMTGALASFSPDEWLTLAECDDLEFIGYNDCVPYGQVLVIGNGTIIRDFLSDEQDTACNRNIGRITFEDDRLFSSWNDAAYYVDSFSDEMTLPGEVDLLILRR